MQGLENQQNQYKVQELTARLQASQQETELIQTLISPHIITTSQSLPTLPAESSGSSSATSKAAQKTIKVNMYKICICMYIFHEIGLIPSIVLIIYSTYLIGLNTCASLIIFCYSSGS